MNCAEQALRIAAQHRLSLQSLIAKLATDTQRDFDRLAKQSARPPGPEPIDRRIDALLRTMRKFRRQNGRPR